MTPVPIPSPVQVLTPKITELQMKQVTNRRDSMSMDYHKGLLNMPGQNNCFLNSAVQVLWHLDIFRRSFRELSGHTCMAECCIFCALKELFAQLQYSQESALPPDALRHALAETFHQRRFQIGGMDDAAECFENILRQIHFHIANQESEDMCSSPHCIPHQKFAMALVEQAICNVCDATSEPLSFTQMVHYVSTSALCSQAEFLTNQHKDPVDSFGHILRKAGGMGETRDCPGACGAKIQTSRILMNHPEIVSIGLVWDSERPSLEHILEVFKSIGMALKIQEMFHSVVDNQWASNTTHHLVGIVTYYGKHYSTFFFHTKLGIWIYFDDATVHEIGPKWEQVIEKCRRGHFQPLLLLYANKNGSPVSGSTAPKSIIMVGKNHKSLKGSGHFHTGVIVSEAGTSICNTVSDISQTKGRILSWEYPYQDGGSIQTKTSHEQNESILKSNLINCTLLHSNQCTMCSSQNLTMPSYYSIESRQQHLHQDCLSPLKCKCGVPFHLSKCLQNPTGQQDLSHWININSSLQSCSVAESQGSILSNHSLDNTSNHLTSNNFTNESTLSDNTSKSNGWRQSCGLHLTVDESPSGSNIREFLSNTETKSQEASGLGNASDNIIDCKTYINRKTVESVLNAQKLKRLRILNENSHSATGNLHSASSLESFDNIQARNTFNKMANLKGELGGTVNVLRRRDSGNWSGDCNSGSSCSSSTSDTPYVHADGNKKLATSNTIGHQNATDNTRSCQHNYMNVGILPDQGYDSFSLSSTDSYPSVSGSPVSSDTHLIQIPKDLQTKLQVTGSLMSAGSESRHLSGHKSKTKVLREDCDKVCAEADLLLMKSHEKEKEGDLVMAAMLSDSAAAKARVAMDAPYNNTQSLVSAKMKHSFCVMRSSNLHKRLNEPEVEERRKQKDLSILEGHHSWQSNQDSRQRSIDGSLRRHSQQGGKDSSSINKNVNAFNLNGERTIEIYATLPKRGNKHKRSPKSKDENQVYRDFTEKQKQTIKADIINQVTDQMTVIGQMNNRESISKKVSSVKTTPEFKVQAWKKQEISHYNILSTKPNVHNYSNRNKDYGKKTSPDKTWSWQLFPNAHAAKQPEDSFMQTSEQCNRKQHKVRRKLISGFFRRKNRSLPDLREGLGQGESITHLFDDCAVAQMSPPNSQDCDVKKKSDSTLDNKVPQVSRGFHQPHCAFIKKNNHHQRSLVKVNPPQVEGVPFKPTCDLTNNHAQDNIDFPVVPPDHMLLIHSRNISHFTLNRETQYVKLPFSFTYSVSTKLPPNQDDIKNEFQQHSVQTDIDPLLQQDSTVQVTNTFLGKIQARHDQMLQSARHNKTTPDELLEKTIKKGGVKEVIDNASLSQSQTEKAYLQDLENKQFQMMQKTHPKEEANKLAETITSGNTCALSQRQTYMDFVDKEQNQIKLTSECCHSHADMKLNVQNLPNTDTSDESHSEVEEIKTYSVKDLTSKFEFVLNQKPVKEKSGKNFVNTISNTPCYEDNSFIEQSNLNSSTIESHLPEKTSVQRYLGVDAVQDTDTSIYSQNMFPDPLNKSILLSSEVQNIHLDMDEDKKWKVSCSTNIVPFVDTCKDIQSSENVSQFSSESEQSKHLPDYVEMQFSSKSKQPQHPPDYETTIQRIGKLKHKTQMKTVGVEKNNTVSLRESVSNYPRTLIETQEDFTTLLLNDQKCNEIGTKSEQLKPSFLGGVSFKDPKSAVTLKKRPGSKKSVTFSEQVILVACADDEEYEHLPNPLLERVYKQHLQERSTTSLVGPLIVNSAEHSCLKTDDKTSDNDLGQRISSAFDSYICNLCHQKTVPSPGVYCPDCSFYMSRFKAG
ncbi:uncharacterized protein LOC143255937 isoform X2 [Tachypleus tridentatus]|uniref:uncharacterized protein LOC143255937 isoform X2 n=1 Tax=Tachypleus tridentatus TaxID=6853 RepID=UPI003FD2574F